MVDLTKHAVLLRELSDGHFHSGTSLGKRLNISRNAICKQVHQLQQQGLEINAITGKGYQLTKPLDLLDAEQISAKTKGPAIEVHGSLPSTNQYLLDKVKQSETLLWGDSCLAEQQTAGRGRRGKSWQSPFAESLALSSVFSFKTLTDSHSFLSLVVGLAIVKSLEQAGATNLTLKWPNDVLYNNQYKLAGILAELTGNAPGPWHAVIGIGVNVHSHPHLEQQSTLPPIALNKILPTKPQRNDIAAKIITTLMDYIEQFNTQGFTPFEQQWDHYDALTDKVIAVHNADKITQGKYLGLGSKGELKLQCQKTNKVLTHHAGQVSIRLPT